MLSPVKTQLQTRNIVSIHHPNAIRVKEAQLTGGRTHDWTVLKELLAPEARIHIPGHGPYGGEWGPDEWCHRLSQLTDPREESWTITPIYAAGNADLVVLFNQVVARRGERVIVQLVTQSWRFQQGKTVEIWEHFTDQLAWENFWS